MNSTLLFMLKENDPRLKLRVAKERRAIKKGKHVYKSGSIFLNKTIILISGI